MSAVPAVGLEGVRILVVLGSIPLFGMELATIGLMEALRARGARVLFVTEATYGRNAVEPLLEKKGFEFRRVGFFGRYERGMTLRRLLIALRMLATESLRFHRIAREFRPTVIHIGTLSFFLNLWPALALGRAPILYRAGDYPSDHTVFHRSAWRYAVYPLIAALVAVSGFVAAAHRRLGLSEGKSTVIYNAMPPERMNSPAHAPDPARLVFVGQVAPHKGVHHLVEAALTLGARYPELKVDIVGPTDSPYAEQLMRTVAAAGMADRVLFHGYQHDPAPFYARAAVHVAPSRCDEAFGMVVLEAKAAAVPSVVFADGALPETVEHERTGLVCGDFSTAALEAALERYLRDPALAREHGAAAQRSIRELGIDRASDQYAALVRKLHETR
jgi:glycosyltransferase involved in cell wall biosynthesis